MRDRTKEKPRPATARFDTKECKILLRALKAAIETGGMLFVDLAQLKKIEAKLEHRIKAEEENEKSKGDTGGAPKEKAESAVGC